MKLKRTIAVLSTSPTNDEARAIAAQIALKDYETSNFEYSVAQHLPDTLEDTTVEYLTKKKESAGDWACFLFVYPKE